jgi:glycosyltransferase involved in cell wall biosynthesis
MAAMKRVLYIWQAGYPWEIRVEKVCSALKEAGYDVTLMARWRPGQAAEEESEGLRILRIGRGLPSAASLPVPFNPVWSSAIRKVVSGWRPDLVIAREIMLVEPAAAACRKRRIPLIIDMAEHYPATMRAMEKYQKGVMKHLVFRARLPDLVERRALARAQGVVTVCDEQNSRLHAMFGYPLDRIAVVHNTPERRAFGSVRRGPGTPPRVFAYHGHMTAQRGLDRLIRGFAEVARREPEIQLDLAGDGDARPSLVELARQCGAANQVRFVGKYRFAELATLYSQTDVGLVTYPADESIDHTIGNKIFDYFACGKPVIASPAAPLRRVVEETGAGLLLRDSTPEAIADGLSQAMSIDLAPLGERGLAAAGAKYNWENDKNVLLNFLARYR